MAHEDLLQLRADHPVLSRGTYLASHTLGAMHRRTPERLAEFSTLWAERGVASWGVWGPEVRRVADLVGSIVGAPPGTTVLRQSVADLLGAVASAVDWSGPRNRVVYSDLEWPSSHYLWTEQQRHGAEVVVVPSEPDPALPDEPAIEASVERLVAAIDERTAVVPISHVLFRTSALVDVRPVVERAHAVGALVVLDAYQSAGCVPVDVVALGVDACVGGSVKWLCGGPGAAWMYVAPHAADRLRPAAVGWWGHARPFDFEFGPMDYAEGAMRFAGGTPGVPSAYAASAGYEAVLAAGVERIRERSVSLTQPLLEDALSRGFTVRSPRDPARRGGAVAIDPGDALRVRDELLVRGFTVDARPGVGLRIGPHFYNSAEECVAVLDAVEEILRETSSPASATMAW
ncbi:aminotransferase class V-fold PLP-dependent enzyme [Motilibacter deserti]|uniref:Aminotransferase class V-fold PLP-dependent enzyme n=1 Tax=Motilibacter deserti TaxID=2714956 RepID=A0ABX0H187_9ACTN|nr:aminotransferase class V-fold PLP-dependent enzyme [Motilibacter deserti]NHC15804.1 aminotransferase class V-fold PLP-dependent enzyme [Motilibacter deserti]